VGPEGAGPPRVQAGLFGEEGVEEKAQGSLVGEGGEGLGQEREEASHPRFAHRDAVEEAEGNPLLQGHRRRQGAVEAVVPNHQGDLRCRNPLDQKGPDLGQDVAHLALHIGEAEGLDPRGRLSLPLQEGPRQAGQGHLHHLEAHPLQGPLRPSVGLPQGARRQGQGNLTPPGRRLL
jgi:hypothetical protein